MRSLSFIQSYPKQVIILSVSWMIALLYSMEFLLSLSMIGFILCSLIEWGGRGLRFRSQLKENFQAFLEQPAWLCITIPFFLVVLSAPYSTEDTGYLLERLRIKIPYLILPFAFWSISSFPSKLYTSLLYIFIILTTITSLGVAINYFLYFDEINELLSQGQHIPTPTSHVRFSLMVTLAIFQVCALYQKKVQFTFTWERYILLGMGIWLVIFLHILSVRSGIAIFYLTAFLLLIQFILQSRKYILGLLIMVGLWALPVGAYYTIPSLHKKVSYMLWDLKMYSEGKGETYSDSGRIRSYRMAKNIIEQQPILGVGAGDLRYEMQQQYALHHPNLPKEAKKMPHNEWISIGAGTGMLGLFLFFVGMFYPIWNKQRYKDTSFLVLNVVILLSFLVENTIENAVGVAFHLLFLLLGMRVLHNSNKNPEPST